MYQPKTGAKCSCKPGVQRDNCPTCEGTGMVVDFAAIRAASARDRGETMQTIAQHSSPGETPGKGKTMRQTLKCGCWSVNGGSDVEHCDLHASAADLLVALTRLLDIAEDQTGVRADTDEGEMAAAQRDARAAIARAKGGK